MTLVIQPHTDYYHSNPAWVELELHGVDVAVTSNTNGTGPLIRIARSMAANQRAS